MPKKIKPQEKEIINAYIDNAYNMAKTMRQYKPQATEESRRVMGSQLLARPEINTYLQRRQAEIKKLSNIRAEEITNELKAIGYSDITNYIGRNAEQLKDLTRQERAAIKKVTTNTKEYITKAGQKIKEESTTIEVHSKIQALQDLAKRIGYFMEHNKQKAPQINLTKIDTNTLNMVLQAIDQGSETPPPPPHTT